MFALLLSFQAGGKFGVSLLFEQGVVVGSWTDRSYG